MHEPADDGDDMDKVAHAVKSTKSNKDLASTLNNFIRKQKDKE